MKIDKKKVVFTSVAIVCFVFMIVMWSDLLTHGFYVEGNDLSDYSQDEKVIHYSLDESGYTVNFSPQENKFAGFEVNIMNIRSEYPVDIVFKISDSDGKEIEEFVASTEEMIWNYDYKVFTHKKYQKGKQYTLSISLPYEVSMEYEPTIQLTNGYWTKEAGNKLLIRFGYSKSVFDCVEKVIISMLMVTLLIFLYGELVSKKEITRFRKVALISALLSLFTWNFMCNSFDEENMERFKTFQDDSDSLVYGVIKAEKENVDVGSGYGLGRYISLDGEHKWFTREFTNDESWNDGYCTYDYRIRVRNNRYTQQFYCVGSVVEFENGEKYTVDSLEYDGEWINLRFNANEFFSPEKCGDLAKAKVYFLDENGELVSQPSGQLSLYESQFGLQGKLFRHIARYLDDQLYLVQLALLCSILTAIAFTVLVVLISKHYGTMLGGCWAVVFLLSPWVTNFSNSIYWVEFTWFVPMIVGLLGAMYYTSRKTRCMVYFMMFLAIFVKSLCGYEYITSVMLGGIAFLCIEFVLCISKSEKKNAILLLRSIICNGIAAVLGFCGAIIIHARIKGEGNIIDGIKYIYERDVLRRVGGGSLNDFGESLWPSLNASKWDVIKIYFHFDTDIITGIDANIFPLLCVIPLGIVLYGYLKKKVDVKSVAMYIVFFVVSISWLVLAKSHSYVHTHMNYVLWYMGYVQTCIYIIVDKISGLLKNEKEH